MRARVLLIDNYDSFTYNLVQALQVLRAEVLVHRNDEITVEEAQHLAPTHLVVSPGPGHPRDAGVSMAIIAAFSARTPVLGVCLGHQALAAVEGGTVGRARSLMHGKTSAIFHDGRTLYRGLSNPFVAGRYHSLAVSADDLPASLEITARTADGEVMGLRHRTLPVEGVQFHPESILTPEGKALLDNFLELEAREALP
ncbi:MAG: aminodeoxychorismate/anthranilate synthase component II [Planctomycetota bacterium]